MKLEITQKGVFTTQSDGPPQELKIGKIVSVKGDNIPAYMLNKCRVVLPESEADALAEEDAESKVKKDAKPKQPITNPARN